MPTSTRTFQVAICGATGAVGREVLSILEQRRFPVAGLRLLASSRSQGLRLPFSGEQLPVEVLGPDSFAGMQIAFFAPGAAVSRSFAPQAAAAGCVVIDKSSAHRTDPEIPLVVPEVNAGDLADFQRKGIISCPNCSTIPLVLALGPIDRAAGIERVVVSTYQSVSGAGRQGIDELKQQIHDLEAGQAVRPRCFSKQIAYNVVPHIDSFEPDGYTKEEHKTINESRRILHLPELRLTATTVRVPVWRGHSLSVNVETARRLDPSEARELLAQAPGVEVVDDPRSLSFPTALDAAGGDLTLVGRIRKDPSIEHGLDLWLVADNLRKGAALNAVQIAEALIEKHL
jgi:aspartate-semialdehyde dehydrogenase